MGFWKKLFQRKKKQEIPEDNWENIVYARDDVDFSKLPPLEGLAGQ